MLQINDYIKYDMALQEYYITINAITNYTQYASDDLGQMKITDKTLKMISHSVYRLMYSWRKGTGKYTHKKYLRKKIYDNNMEEVTMLMLAMIEAVKGAVESGMDLNAYINEPKDTLPSTVKDELRQANLLDSSEKLDRNLDITYTQEEINATQ